MTLGLLLDRLQALLNTADPATRKRAVTMLAADHGVTTASAAPKKRRGNSPEKSFSYESSLGNTETVDLRRFDRECNRVLREHRLREDEEDDDDE